MRFEPWRRRALRGDGRLHGLGSAQIDEQRRHTGQMAIGQFVRFMQAGPVADENETGPHQRQGAQGPQQQVSNPIKLIPKPIPVNGSHSQTNQFYNSRHKILVKSLHELDENRSYVDSDDWYDTILIDDFRDLKM